MDRTLRPSSPPPALALPRRAESRQWSGGVVRVLEHDPDLLEGLDAESAEAARAHAVAPTLVLGPGHWTPPPAERCERVLGLLVLEGLMTRGVTINGVPCPELLGQGDVLRPWDEPADLLERHGATTWRILQPVTLAVLGAPFVETIRRWPWITQALLSRSVNRTRWLALQMAVPQIRRADDRLRLLFGDLAARWGRVTPEGVVLPLPLTNQLLAQLACLRRPTVSSTMTRFAETGEVVRRPSGGFVLDLQSDSSPAGGDRVVAA